MSTLTGLKLVAAKVVRAQQPESIKRTKLIERLREQQALFAAKQSGSTYQPSTIKTIVDKDTGERRQIETVKRVREWFWRAENGKLNLLLRYGTKTLTLGKGGKNAIEIDRDAEFDATVNAVIAAVQNGELDEAIAELSAQTRKGFGK